MAPGRARSRAGQLKAIPNTEAQSWTDAQLRQLNCTCTIGLWARAASSDTALR